MFSGTHLWARDRQHVNSKHSASISAVIIIMQRGSTRIKTTDPNILLYKARVLFNSQNNEGALQVHFRSHSISGSDRCTQVHELANRVIYLISEILKFAGFYLILWFGVNILLCSANITKYYRKICSLLHTVFMLVPQITLVGCLQPRLGWKKP